MISSLDGVEIKIATRDRELPKRQALIDGWKTAMRMFRARVKSCDQPSHSPAPNYSQYKTDFCLTVSVIPDITARS